MKRENRELSKLKRQELLELLLEETKRNEELEKANLKLAEELASRRIQIENAGSIAEAALQLNGVFEAAQKAAQDYLDNIKELSERQETKTESNASRNVAPNTDIN